MPQLDDPIKLHNCLIKALHGISFYDSRKPACNAPVNPYYLPLVDSQCDVAHEIELSQFFV